MKRLIGTVVLLALLVLLVGCSGPTTATQPLEKEKNTGQMSQKTPAKAQTATTTAPVPAEEPADDEPFVGNDRKPAPAEDDEFEIEQSPYGYKVVGKTATPSSDSQPDALNYRLLFEGGYHRNVNKNWYDVIEVGYYFDNVNGDVHSASGELLFNVQDIE